MLCLIFLSTITISLSGIYSEHVVKAGSIKYPQEVLFCKAHCHELGRICARPPNHCGACSGNADCLPVPDDSNDLGMEGCPELRCDHPCQFGHLKNEHNCPICRCLPAPAEQLPNPACPMPECANFCPNGYANNERGCMTCKCNKGKKVKSKRDRNVMDEEDIDSIIEAVRNLGQNHDEIAKEKPMLGSYGGGRNQQGYPYDLPGYNREDTQGGRRYYQAVRGQKTRMPAWDRGEGLVNQEVPPPVNQEVPPPRVHGGRLGNNRHHYKHEQEQEVANQEKVHEYETPPREIQDMQEVEVPPQEEEEHIEKESDPKTDVKIAPVPQEIKDHDRPTHPTPAARQEFDGRLHPVQEVASMADIYFLDVQAPGGAAHAAADSGDPTTVAPPHHSQQVAAGASGESSYTLNDEVFTAVVAGCSVAGLVGLVVAGVCWYRLQKNVKATSEVEYPAYGITGPTKEALGSPGDRKLAQSAQMYHYQHQKQQMIALEKANGEMKNDGSEDDSDEENEEGDYTVYECPGLAPTGEMEVKNPLFSEETPVTPTPDDRREMK